MLWAGEWLAACGRVGRGRHTHRKGKGKSALAAFACRCSAVHISERREGEWVGVSQGGARLRPPTNANTHKQPIDPSLKEAGACLARAANWLVAGRFRLSVVWTDRGGPAAIAHHSSSIALQRTARTHSLTYLPHPMHTPYTHTHTASTIHRKTPGQATQRDDERRLQQAGSTPIVHPFNQGLLPLLRRSASGTDRASCVCVIGRARARVGAAAAPSVACPPAGGGATPPALCCALLAGWLVS